MPILNIVENSARRVAPPIMNFDGPYGMWTWAERLEEASAGTLKVVFFTNQFIGNKDIAALRDMTEEDVMREQRTTPVLAIVPVYEGGPTFDPNFNALAARRDVIMTSEAWAFNFLRSLLIVIATLADNKSLLTPDLIKQWLLPNQGRGERRLRVE